MARRWMETRQPLRACMVAAEGLRLRGGDSARAEQAANHVPDADHTISPRYMQPCAPRWDGLV